jgi:hypothetical protein
MNRTIQTLVRLALLLGMSIAAMGCDDNLVGRICDLGQVPREGEVVIASPSLDCISRTCLRVPLTRTPLPEGVEYPEGNQGLCTAECSSDDDCDRVPESPCKSGFTCGIANSVGTLCCKKVCICKDYFLVPANNEGCDPSNEDNTCCNLEGRKGNPKYPACIPD